MSLSRSPAACEEVGAIRSLRFAFFGVGTVEEGLGGGSCKEGLDGGSCSVRWLADVTPLTSMSVVLSVERVLSSLLFT